MGELPGQVPYVARALSALDQVRPVLLEPPPSLALRQPAPARAEVPEDEAEPLLRVEWPVCLGLGQSPTPSGGGDAAFHAGGRR